MNIKQFNQIKDRAKQTGMSFTDSVKMKDANEIQINNPTDLQKVYRIIQKADGEKDYGAIGLKFGNNSKYANLYADIFLVKRDGGDYCGQIEINGKVDWLANKNIDVVKKYLMKTLEQRYKEGIKDSIKDAIKVEFVGVMIEFCECQERHPTISSNMNKVFTNLNDINKILEKEDRVAYNYYQEHGYNGGGYDKCYFKWIFKVNGERYTINGGRVDLGDGLRHGKDAITISNKDIEYMKNKITSGNMRFGSGLKKLDSLKAKDYYNYINKVDVSGLNQDILKIIRTEKMTRVELDKWLNMAKQKFNISEKDISRYQKYHNAVAMERVMNDSKGRDSYDIREGAIFKKAKSGYDSYIKVLKVDGDNVYIKTYIKQNGKVLESDNPSPIIKNISDLESMLKVENRQQVRGMDSVKDAPSQEKIKYYQSKVDEAIRKYGRIGGGLYTELDDNQLWVDDRGGKYIVKSVFQDSVKDGLAMDLWGLMQEINGNRNKVAYTTNEELVQAIQRQRPNKYKITKEGNKYKVELLDSVHDVYPRENESKNDFIARFMNETKKEYPNEKQRLAVAHSYWEKGRDSVKDELTSSEKMLVDWFFDKYYKKGMSIDELCDKMMSSNSNNQRLIYNRENDVRKYFKQKIGDSVKDSMESEVRQWWRDVEKWNRENGNRFSINNDGASAEDMLIAMWDMIGDLKGADNRLYNNGKRIYNKYSQYSQYRDSIKDSVHLAHFVSQSGQDMFTKRFSSRAELDRYLNQNFKDRVYDMSGMNDLYTKRNNDLDVAMHWKIVIRDSLKDKVADFLNVKDGEDIQESIIDEDVKSLTEEEKKAIEDYKRAIAETDNPKMLEIYSHILREEIDHLRELKESQMYDSVKDKKIKDEIVYAYIDKTQKLESNIQMSSKANQCECVDLGSEYRISGQRDDVEYTLDMLGLDESYIDD